MSTIPPSGTTLATTLVAQAAADQTAITQLETAISQAVAASASAATLDALTVRLQGLKAAFNASWGVPT
jgi:hypothetical protein